MINWPSTCIESLIWHSSTIRSPLHGLASQYHRCKALPSIASASPAYLTDQLWGTVWSIVVHLGNQWRSAPRKHPCGNSGIANT